MLRNMNGLSSSALVAYSQAELVDLESSSSFPVSTSTRRLTCAHRPTMSPHKRLPSLSWSGCRADCSVSDSHQGQCDSVRQRDHVLQGEGRNERSGQRGRLQWVCPALGSHHPEKRAWNQAGRGVKKGCLTALRNLGDILSDREAIAREMQVPQKSSAFCWNQSDRFEVPASCCRRALTRRPAPGVCSSRGWR